MHPFAFRVPLDGRGKGALPSPILGRSIPRGRDVALLLNWQARADHNLPKPAVRRLGPTDPSACPNLLLSLRNVVWDPLAGLLSALDVHGAS